MGAGLQTLLKQHRPQIIAVIGVDGYDHIPQLLAGMINLKLYNLCIDAKFCTLRQQGGQVRCPTLNNQLGYCSHLLANPFNRGC